MDKIKNYVIAILTGLLALSLFTQPAQSAGKSKEAKAMEYHVCMSLATQNSSAIIFPVSFTDDAIKTCAKYRP
jgi:hypothetical protein